MNGENIDLVPLVNYLRSYLTKLFIDEGAVPCNDYLMQAMIMRYNRQTKDMEEKRKIDEKAALYF